MGSRLVGSLTAILAGEGCLRIHTIARNTSVAFFENLGFATLPDGPLIHPEFVKHRITFEKMVRTIDQV